MKKGPGPRGSRDEEFLVPSLVGIPKGVDKIHHWPYSNKITHFQTRDWKLSSLLVSWCCIWRWSFWICNNCKRSYFGKFTIIWSMILMWSSYCLTYSNQIYLVTFMQFFDTPGTPGGASIVERKTFEFKKPLCQLCYCSSHPIFFLLLLLDIRELQTTAEH